jgi:hypothetical protein
MEASLIRASFISVPYLGERRSRAFLNLDFVFSFAGPGTIAISAP